MPGAQIRFDQAANPTPVGTPGVARDDIWLTQPVVCHSVLSGNTAWQWSFLDVPPGSAAVFSGSTTATATFTPDIPGTYRIQLVTNSGGLGNIVVLVIRVRYSSTGVLLFHGLCLPAFGERVGEDNVLIPPTTGAPNERGYAPFFEAVLAYVLTLGGGGGVTPPTVISATGNLALPDADTVYLVESGATIDLTFTGTPLDGLELTFIDGTGTWQTYPLHLTAQGGHVLRYPQFPFTSATTIYCDIQGGAFTLKWSSAENQWDVKSVALGYTPPFTGNFDANLSLSDGSNIWALPSSTTGTLTLEDGGLTGPAVVVQTDFGSYQIAVYNNTAYPVALQGYFDTAPVGTVPPGVTALWVQINGVNFTDMPPSIVLVLTGATFYDKTVFRPATVAPCTVAQSQAKARTFQTTNNTPVTVLTVPLPGTAGSPISSLTTPGQTRLHVSVGLQSTTTVDGAWFELTWAFVVQTSGTANAMGSAAVASLAIGNSVGTPQAVPAGWAVSLVLDGGQENLLVVVTGDTTLVVNGSVQAEWGDLQ